MSYRFVRVEAEPFWHYEQLYSPEIRNDLIITATTLLRHLMKRCPECRKDYFDDSLMYCLDDGASLSQGSIALESATAVLPSVSLDGDNHPTALLSGSPVTDKNVRSESSGRRNMASLPWIIAGIVGLGLVTSLGYIAFYLRPSMGQAAVVRFSVP